MKIILPNRGEFGLKLWAHVPSVAAIPGPKIVLHEPGEECLYPSADRLVEVPRAKDDNKRGLQANNESAAPIIEIVSELQKRNPDADTIQVTTDMPRARFVPEPTVRHGITTDVVVCPRKRAYGAAKNWPEWPTLTERLRTRGISTFAGGQPDTSYKVKGPAAWDYDRPLDATVEAMRSARLVVATDAGLAHLAVLCGAPLLVLTHACGLVAPGPQVDATGRVMQPAYGPVKVERYREANHTDSPIEFLHHAWTNYALVIRRVLEITEQAEAA